MSVPDTLSLRTEVDLSGLSRDFKRASDQVEAFLTGSNASLESLKVNVGTSGGGAGATGGGSDAASSALSSLAPLAGKIKGAFQGALAPLTEFAGRIEARFNAMGGAIAAVGDRAQAHFKFIEATASVKEFFNIFESHKTGILQFFARATNFPYQIKKAFFNMSGGFKAIDLYQYLEPTKKFASEVSKIQSAFDRLKSPKIDVDHSVKNVLKIRNALGAVAEKAKSVGGEIAIGLGAFGLIYKLTSGFADFFSKGISGASSLNETLNKTDVILGDAAPAAKKLADDLATNFGFVKGVTLDTASSFGALGKSLGRLQGDQLSGFTTDFTKLAADLTSLKNIDLSESAGAIKTALAGQESDQLKQLGVITNETAIKQYALAHGIRAVGKEFSESQKFMIRSKIIAEGLAFASGDLERTGGGAANQWRKFTGTLTNLAESIGATLLPALTYGLTMLNDFSSFAYQAFEGSKEFITSWSDRLMDGFDLAYSVVVNWKSAWQVAKLSIIQAATNIVEWIEVLPANAAIFANYIANNWRELIFDGINAVATMVKNLGTNLWELGSAFVEFLKDPTQGFQFNWTPLLDTFKATAQKLPEILRPHLTDMSDEIAKAAQPIADTFNSRRLERLKAKAAPTMARSSTLGPEGLATDDKKTNEKKFAAAMELGSKEAYSSIVNATGGKPSNDVNKNTKATAMGVRESNATLRRIEQNTSRQPRPLVI